MANNNKNKTKEAVVEEAVVEEAVVEEAVVEEAVVEEAKKEATVKIKLPLSRTEKDDVLVGVNGRTWLIKRGVEVEVPKCVAEVLQHSEEMLAQAFAFEEAHANII